MDDVTPACPDPEQRFIAALVRSSLPPFYRISLQLELEREVRGLPPEERAAAYTAATADLERIEKNA